MVIGSAVAAANVFLTYSSGTQQVEAKKQRNPRESRGDGYEVLRRETREDRYEGKDEYGDGIASLVMYTYLT
jgi:hypothetical protein